jgi:prevent-host-death family protein
LNRRVSVVEAKNKLPSIIHEVEQGSIVEITRHGKAVAIVVGQKDYERLKEKGQGFWVTLGKMRNLLSSEGIVFEESDFLNLRDPSTGRSFVWTE